MLRTAFGLFDLNWDTFLQNMEGHIQRCPPIESVGIASTVCGPEAFTPDHKPLVGPQPGVVGFWQARSLSRGWRGAPWGLQLWRVTRR